MLHFSSPKLWFSRWALLHTGKGTQVQFCNKVTEEKKVYSLNGAEKTVKLDRKKKKCFLIKNVNA